MLTLSNNLLIASFILAAPSWLHRHWQALSRKTMRSELSPLASGSSGSMPNISKARLQNLLVPLPPIDLQLKYKEVVNEFWSYKGYQHQTTLHTDNLFNLLLQKAFRGEL